MELRLLGGVALYSGDQPEDTGSGRQRCVLAALALDAGQVVPTDRLVDRVWGATPPPRARATLQSYLSRLRRTLRGGGSDIVHRTGGYVLEMALEAIDLHRFRVLAARARGGTRRDSVPLLREALELWRGDALTGLDGHWAAGERDRLHQERTTAENELADALLEEGRGEELVAGLGARVAAAPLDERTMRLYLRSLQQTGRVAEALTHYQDFRRRLVEELGIEPGAALQEAHQRLLCGAPEADAPAAPRLPVPRQLPAPPRHFAGRHPELDRLDAAFDATAVAIAGAGGIGKTWLALHWAHRHLDRFPDGQLYVDLRGFSPDESPMEPGVAVRGFLDALGVTATATPQGLHAQAALFRSLVQDKELLLILDNAADSAQLTHLLPGGPGCTVLITSRDQLQGLVVEHEVHHVRLEALSDEEAGAVLEARLGTPRAVGEAAAVREIVRMCGGFPLALSIVASQLHTRPSANVAAMAAELREAGLDALDAPDPTASLPAALSWSRKRLTTGQARVFALLGLMAGPDISLPAAARLTGLPVRRAHSELRALEHASLITPDSAGRYSMHDLLFRYAMDTADELPPAETEAALRRLVDFYAATAYAADRVLSPHRPQVTTERTIPVGVPEFPGTAEALCWFEREHRCLLAAQQVAGARQWHRSVWELAWSMDTFHARRAHRHEDLDSWRTALVSAEHLPDPDLQATTHRLAGTAHADLGLHDEAVHHLGLALAIAEKSEDETSQARAHAALAWVRGQRGQPAEALGHALGALRLQERLGNPVWIADAANTVGWYYAKVGDHNRARKHCLSALGRYRGANELDGEAATHDSLGYLESQAGHLQLALEHYRKALSLRRETGDVVREASTLERIGDTHAALDDYGSARRNWRLAVALYRAQGSDHEAAVLLARLGEEPGLGKLG
ncbi:AfsR/SARP family transcriptional regulator [Amycolatopsis magusensis]|uniref:AfsR/SARP family transcriptional regulator n=1 Tax=Amycolatopsis magusensis TaxID=882444 RepID=UPI00378B6659